MIKYTKYFIKKKNTFFSDRKKDKYGDEGQIVLQTLRYFLLY